MKLKEGQTLQLDDGRVKPAEDVIAVIATIFGQSLVHHALCYPDVVRDFAQLDDDEIAESMAFCFSEFYQRWTQA